MENLNDLAGDILLLLGPPEQLPDVVDWLGCLMLADRGLEVTRRRQAWTAIGVFAAAIIAASLGWLYLPLALAIAVVAYVVLNIVPLNQVYESVEWSVIVLLGAMIPIGAALESSGGSSLIANALVGWTEGLPVVAVLVILMVITMTLSDVLNNVATALVAVDAEAVLELGEVLLAVGALLAGTAHDQDPWRSADRLDVAQDAVRDGIVLVEDSRLGLGVVRLLQ